MTEQTILGLPVGFWEGLIGTVVGGVLSVLGGFFATLWIRSRDNAAVQRRADDEFQAATVVVVDEMNANIATLEVTLQHDQNSIRSCTTASIATGSWCWPCGCLPM